MISPVNALATHGYFIDKLNVYQVHDADLPLIGKTGVIDFDLLTGETADTPKANGKLPIMASYSTSLRVHCDGHRVYIEGNPSRFGRCENLFGFSSIDDCISVYNHVLRSLGLPPFSFEFLQGKDGTKQRKMYTGAVITHIDITKNHQVGMGDEYAFLRAISTLSLMVNTPSYTPRHDFENERYMGLVFQVDLIDKQRSNLKDATKTGLIIKK